MEALRKLLKDLGSDAKLAAEYERNPDEVMKARGLPEDARAAMKGKDVEAVRKLAGLGEVHLSNSTIKCHD
ncbi:MAG: hypothetical protein U5L08_15120 [Xanthomonadales bacterium]|nr:hypothetical protein [Xanthomonadales bacterium]